MNPKGHSKSLVPAQPGNLNAAKTGVFSERLLAPRVTEAEAALAAQRPEDTHAEVLRHELAALVVLAQLMDASLEQDGIRGRGGEPRSLIDRRLRLNDRLRHTLSQYTEGVQSGIVVAVSDEVASKPADVPEELAETIARVHHRDSIKLIRPVELDPEMFLRAVVVTDDPAVTFDDRMRARRLLTRRAQQRAELCVCSATLVARNEFELRDWIREAHSSGVAPDEHDAWIATLVRRDTSGERLEPWVEYQRTWNAIQTTVQEGVDRVLGKSQRRDKRSTREGDAAIGRFWKTLLSSTRVKPAQRVKAFVALHEAGVLPQCKCHRKKEKLAELQADLVRAYIIRSVGQQHYRAALVIARFPETHHAVRDAIDAKILNDESEAAEQKQPQSG